MTEDLFTLEPWPLTVARNNEDKFTAEFLAYLPENIHIYRAFEKEAKLAAARGFQHYSARTIIEVLRHHSALQESGGGWKLNNDNTPYLARLFGLVNPESASLFEFRVAKSVKHRVDVPQTYSHASGHG